MFSKGGRQTGREGQGLQKPDWIVAFVVISTETKERLEVYRERRYGHTVSRESAVSFRAFYNLKRAATARSPSEHAKIRISWVSNDLHPLLRI